MPAPSCSRAGRVLALLLGLLLLAGSGAQAQIVKEKPARIRAANRRALREARRVESPYKDSHLDVTRDRLRRGGSSEPAAPGSARVDYATGLAPNVKPPGRFGLRRRTAIQDQPPGEVRKIKEKRK